MNNTALCHHFQFHKSQGRLKRCPIALTSAQSLRWLGDTQNHVLSHLHTLQYPTSEKECLCHVHCSVIHAHPPHTDTHTPLHTQTHPPLHSDTPTPTHLPTHMYLQCVQDSAQVNSCTVPGPTLLLCTLDQLLHGARHNHMIQPPPRHTMSQRHLYHAAQIPHCYQQRVLEYSLHGHTEKVTERESLGGSTLRLLHHFPQVFAFLKLLGLHTRRQTHIQTPCYIHTECASAVLRPNQPSLWLLAWWRHTSHTGAGRLAGSKQRQHIISAKQLITYTKQLLVNNCKPCKNNLSPHTPPTRHLPCSHHVHRTACHHTHRQHVTSHAVITYIIATCHQT